MNFLIILLVAMLNVFVGVCAETPEPDSFLDPCSVTDMDCLSRSTEKFLEKTAPGIPEYGFKAIDPLIIPSLDVNYGQITGLNFSQINITGLKKQKVSDFTMNTDAKNVVFETEAKLHIVALVHIDLPQASKSFSGLFTMDNSIVGTMDYNYEIKTDANGVEFFDISPAAIISCDPMHDNIVLAAHLIEELENDADGSIALQAAYDKKISCVITEKAYEYLYSNIVTATKLWPKTAFFTNV